MRNVTNTPGQALALLNDPIFVESARVLAMRICEPHGQTDQERLQAAFWAALQRHPSRAESDVLMNLLTHQREHYRQSTDDAEAVVAIGQYPAPSPETASEIAAWTSVTRAILNLHELLNRP